EDIAQAQQAKNPAAHEYRLSGDDIVRVFHLDNTPTPKMLQEIATDVRSIADIRRLFIYTNARAMTVRGGPSQIALAEWLVSQLDQPASAPPRTAEAREYRPSGTVDDVVRVFFLTHADSPQRLQQIATEVRTTTAVKRLFTYNGPHAMALRGTAGQIAWADRLI